MNLTEATRPAPAPYEIGELKFLALGDRVIIVEDEFKSGYECPACGGSGKSPLNPEMRCKTCEGKGGVLVVPEQSQRRPTSGQIVSAGELCKVLKPGENVMYSNFAGFAVDLDRAGHKVCLRILHETEVLCRIEGHLELRNLRHQTEVTSI